MKTIFNFILLACLLSDSILAQDTFSIVALDSSSRQVGSAGASCLDLDQAGIANPAFLTDLLPDTGAINTQSYFVQANQDNARARMRLGETPQQIISWLVANDAINNPEFKQYGVVGFQGPQGMSASHSGSTCIDHKGQRNGSINGFYYAIQGNILKGPEILDSMESRFIHTDGPLACRLMAAMQGAKVIGADTRCNTAGTSSLFAFLQLANPTDSYGSPTVNISLKTHETDGIEPIDSLQTLFDALQLCTPLGLHETVPEKPWVCQHPLTGQCLVVAPYTEGNYTLQLNQLSGKQIRNFTWQGQKKMIDLSCLAAGIYPYQLWQDGRIIDRGKLVVQ